ncbi:PINIT domain-containing protein [Multifurca ochricompacta]|uniref:PINIT domain-containing protein n=1 Tax=Multifurca ochricompacta TaxID=376703 RepID=A0AAD4MFY7_9AGAM|nr:PINIT domain-containing protein [Multifurca ochricompacta]
MSAVDPWGDYEVSLYSSLYTLLIIIPQTLKVNVRHNTVDRLKQIIAGFNDECWTMLSKSGKKQDLIDRILNSLHEWRVSSNMDKWNKARSVLYQVRNSGMWRGHAHSAQGLLAPPTANSYQGASPAARPYLGPTAGPSNPPRYEPFAPPPRNPTLPITTPSPHTSTPATLPRPAIRFKPSPFFQIHQAVSNIAECPESSSSGDRRQQVLLFSLNSDQIAKLNSSDPKYQLRLYCTSSSYFALGTAGLRFGGNPCPIEFPPTCEIRVNQVQITANTKGLKKKPGTAPPAHLGSSVRVSIGHQNRVEMVYVNSQTNTNQPPPPPKKYYMAVMLVQVTTVDQLIERVKKGKFRSREDVLAQRKQPVNDEDDDIIAGPQKTSLKCPLSYCRINTPCRSLQCVHVQCFDALSWYSVNEQTTTWSCPVCEKAINHEELIVDGYFGSILESTPDTVEDVIVEANGEWHTSDDRYASDVWKETHKPMGLPASPTLKPKSQTTPKSPSGHTCDAEKSQNPEDVVVLDSEEEDEGEVKRELSPSRRERSPVNGVIDLTVESESDEESAPGQSLERKRKADIDSGSPTEEIWKKSRIGDSPNATATVTVARTGSGNANNNFTSEALESSNNHGARRYALNGTPLQQQQQPQQRSHSAQFATSSITGSSYATTYYTQPSRVVTSSTGPFGPQVSHRTAYYSQFGNG